MGTESPGDRRCFPGQPRERLRRQLAFFGDEPQRLAAAAPGYRLYVDAWTSATLDQAGHTADAVGGFFEKFVGKTPPPGEVGDHDTLLANLPTACTMLANACDAYADHVETAKQ
ncbi:hypothetical protein ACVB8X_37615 [Streptomyces sp. NRAIS4]